MITSHGKSATNYLRLDQPGDQKFFNSGKVLTRVERSGTYYGKKKNSYVNIYK